ncbi:tripartite tricarboxylate transporter substrate binding protein [Actinoalloteichus sp. AHMU CJ021]|uniref:Tricarboxylic transport membrane protein n=1 Tax=Actinoalloteichus caeruleus DSM 43889 TaxID=1120930 RepID=A0ABT1JFG6_ACTCY|nr:tripartite tricarboxylate transporter substrate-binding protein [Actinoalloteichus caeruleus]AUS77340.1 tripartite tricarboxylate transporter substrate binding protein [Actinoalloteichus sp. AHMU CJ021]MCP2331158.1 putative tricarboxylic transport membrane protein [Actinoalloteichus caeruleus DSM 43889]
MRPKRPLVTGIYGVVVAALVVLAGIDAGNSAAGASARNKLTLMAPAAPGGGWDLAARESQQALRSSGVVNNAQVVNVPGAGGTIGLSQTVGRAGDETTLMVTGTVMLGAVEVNGSEHGLDDVTPIARLADDYVVVVVPADSPYQTLDDFLADWRSNPHGTAIGGGSLGGTDHLLAGLLAQEGGVDPGSLNYISYAGGGEVMTALLSHTVAVGVSGYNDFSDQIEAGRLRALGVSAAEPVEGIEIPTFIEQGVDVELPNWRGVMAPPGLTDEARAEMEAIITEMVETEEWADALDRNRWADTFMVGEEFEEFLDQDIARIRQVIEELGL